MCKAEFSSLIYLNIEYRRENEKGLTTRVFVFRD